MRGRLCQMHWLLQTLAWAYEELLPKGPFPRMKGLFRTQTHQGDNDMCKTRASGGGLYTRSFLGMHCNVLCGCAWWACRLRLLSVLLPSFCRLVRKGLLCLLPSVCIVYAAAAWHISVHPYNPIHVDSIEAWPTWNANLPTHPSS